jgi:acid phosphatase type 7
VLFSLAVAIAMATAVPTALQAQNVRITSGSRLDTVSGNAVFISWSTDLPSSSRVWYGKDKNNLTHLAEGLERGVTNHAVTISGLDSNTIYYFQLESGQTRGTRAEGEAESADC